MASVMSLCNPARVVASFARRVPSTRALSLSAREAPPHTRAQPQVTSTFPPKKPASTKPPPSSSFSSSSSSSSNSPDDEDKKKKPLQKPRNEAIRHRFVRLVNPETGALDPPTDIKEILARVDRKRQYLELVTETPEPIVKFINVKDMYNRDKAKHVQQQLGRAPEEKEVQLTWGVDAGDLAYKLRKARSELKDGNRVSLVFAPKKGQARPTPEEQTKMVDEALRLLEDVGRERKEREVRKEIVALFLEGLRGKQVHELKWAYTGDESWTGLKGALNALRGGGRVDVVFSLPPPPKAARRDPALKEKVVDPDVVKERFIKAIHQLTELGREWKIRDSRKTSVVVHLEPKEPDTP
ncbi:hypothetical protein L226DRAFT_613415 [Lentinus tigrinus ALCF2SS1-7]|uniref:Altered inheritance of mitochondria protein 23, mitochondrial n=1 Tax=Lentinus tigrinus ALCF2SS1-6 TaxID=1328759 RepID=A0A5C2SEI9_9APHY|nr:hypothetical protein L227DRAFT_652232 [Lentinus tigrinus ALCF2SS1-6]RPD74590.1 hypothetical protein L226DRAFT_613415 [Lentinus tigrinus ALCF2SS1-7]